MPGQYYYSVLSYTFEEYIERIQTFHGFAAPGAVIGGITVGLAYQHLPEDGLFDFVWLMMGASITPVRVNLHIWYQKFRILAGLAMKGKAIIILTPQSKVEDE